MEARFVRIRRQSALEDGFLASLVLPVLSRRAPRLLAASHEPGSMESLAIRLLRLRRVAAFGRNLSKIEPRAGRLDASRNRGLEPFQGRVPLALVESLHSLVERAPSAGL